MGGYTADEKLRLQQLRALRRRWLRDQELSEREPVLPERRLGPIAAFWERFLQPGGLWRQKVSGAGGPAQSPGPEPLPPSPGPEPRSAVPQVFNAYQTSGFIFMRVLIPAWLLHYYLKYHVSVCGLRGWGGLGSA